jgi:hypothetical protein
VGTVAGASRCGIVSGETARFFQFSFMIEPACRSLLPRHFRRGDHLSSRGRVRVSIFYEKLFGAKIGKCNTSNSRPNTHHKQCHTSLLKHTKAAIYCNILLPKRAITIIAFGENSKQHSYLLQ